MNGEEGKTRQHSMDGTNQRTTSWSIVLVGSGRWRATAMPTGMAGLSGGVAGVAGVVSQRCCCSFSSHVSGMRGSVRLHELGSHSPEAAMPRKIIISIDSSSHRPNELRSIDGRVAPTALYWVLPGFYLVFTGFSWSLLG